ncbi:hypothetical protein GGI15_001560 [Coemansia interrupta]|uniref:DNA/RNA-binding protein Alba-like domain-containing protein n=1 Tax=Coemansia interrupta TaxID=1126814 RepID=A0A9W8LNR8_9FUNG|nr:hypothetical protein GGI15_001560 [Coemansia interrupta]
MKSKTKLKHKLRQKQKHAPAAAIDALDMRITTHGKIEAYVAHITARLAAASARPFFVYAEGPAVPKLVSVVEIAKRRRPPGTTICEMSCGNTRSSPCPLKTSTAIRTAEPVAAAAAASGIYAARALANTATDADTDTDTAASASHTPRPRESIWLLAKLTQCIAE